MAKPAAPPSPPDDSRQDSRTAQPAPRPPAASADEAARQQWLDAQIQEQYQDIAREPLPERLVALIRGLRLFRG